MIGRRTTIRRRATQLSLWLPIGAACTVLNAWFCAAFLPIGSTIDLLTLYNLPGEIDDEWFESSWPYSAEQFATLREMQRRVQSKYDSASTQGVTPVHVGLLHSISDHLDELNGTGYRFERVFVQTSDSSLYQCVVTRTSMGWPYLAMTGSHWELTDSAASRYNELRLVNAIAISSWSFSKASKNATLLFSRVLPLQPFWTGFIINTLFHATALWLLIRGPFTLRRWRRARRGLCLRCAYPIGQSEQCTECGSIVRKQSAME